MKSHFNFSKQERSGIFFLLVLILLFQLIYFGLRNYAIAPNEMAFELDAERQMKFDSLVLAVNTSNGPSVRPFNPNYISDFKGYTLGMSSEEIDRLNQFRTQGKFVNSVSEFQQVTGVSDSLLNTIAPYFKFPDWVKDKIQKSPRPSPQKTSISKLLDLNKATANDLREINGIGEKLSARIIKFRDRLGGFLVNEQLYDVYGLEQDVADRALKRFQVLQPPTIKKININTATVDELASLVYLRYHVAENIVTYREENGTYTSPDDLFNVPDFPINKIERIALYLFY